MEAACPHRPADSRRRTRRTSDQAARTDSGTRRRTRSYRYDTSPPAKSTRRVRTCTLTRAVLTSTTTSERGTVSDGVLTFTDSYFTTANASSFIEFLPTV